MKFSHARARRINRSRGKSANRRMVKLRSALTALRAGEPFQPVLLQFKLLRYTFHDHHALGKNMNPVDWLFGLCEVCGRRTGQWYPYPVSDSYCLCAQPKSGIPASGKVLTTDPESWIEQVKEVRPRPVSKSFIESLRIAGARPALLAHLEKEHEATCRLHGFSARRTRQ